MKFVKDNNLLIITYSPINGTEWIRDAFKNDNPITIGKTFTFFKEDLLEELVESKVVIVDEFDLSEEGETNYDEQYDDSDREIKFVLSTLENGYYKMKPSVFDIDHNIYFQEQIKFEPSLFKAYNNISILRRIDKVISEDLYIGSEEDNLPFEVYQKLITTFPNSYEIGQYALSRIDNILKEHVSTSKDFTSKYNSYLNKKSSNFSTGNLLTSYAQYETEKYKDILLVLKKMLKNEIGYSEKDWQKKIMEIITLIYPKYVAVIDEVTFTEEYNNKSRRLDFMLIDSGGSIDIVEIKKPSQDSIISANKYRDNYIPLKVLSGTIMQIEKYIYYLNKLGKNGEEMLTNKYRKYLPENINIKITNPKAIIIIGREDSMNKTQLYDFEIIKRKYSNIIDIITYDDLIRRIEQTINRFESKITNVI